MKLFPRLKILAILILASLIASTAASAADAAKTIRAGATPTPHAEVLNFAKGLLAKQGWTLEVKEFNDYLLPNMALNEGELDANMYQHQPFLDDFNKAKGADLISVGAIVLVPMAIYSQKIKSLDAIPAGASIAIPNDPSNESRALDLIAKAGLIEFKPGANTLKTPLDLGKNPKNLKFIELKAPQLPRALADTDLAVITTNFALGAKLNPQRDGIFMEDKDNIYARIVLAVKRGQEKSEKTQALLKALTSEETRDFIVKTYQGAVLPAF